MESIKKKWFWGIFISLLAFFAMSHNASAVDTTLDVEYVNAYDISSIRCAVQNGPFVTISGRTCVWGTNVGGDLQGRGLSFIETQNIPITGGLYYEMYIDVAISNEAQLMIPVMWAPQTTGNFSIVNFEQVSVNENIGSSATNEGFVSTYRVILRARVTGNFPVQFGDDNRVNNVIYLVGDPWSVIVDTRIHQRIFAYRAKTAMTDQNIVNAINQLKQQEAQQQQQERQELEQGQSDLQDAGADSSQDAQQGTASLLSAISQAVGVISSASPTNCKLNGNMGNLNMGQLDLCANPAPVFVQTIGSLILILICVPLAISLFNRFINLFRSFQS